jgi:hypothetical protein
MARSITEARIIFLRNLAYLINFAIDNHIRFIITTFYRDAEEQKKLFNEKKSLCDGIFKKSKHQFWLAVDIVIIEDDIAIWQSEKYKFLSEFWKSLSSDCHWGGDIKELNDIYHFDLIP